METNKPSPFSSLLNNGAIFLDKVADWIPGLSTITNLVNLVEKAILNITEKGASATSPHYFRHIKNKDTQECALLLIPFLGNILAPALRSVCKRGKYLEGMGEKEKAFNVYKDAACKGDLDARVELGRCYENKIGTEENLRDAFLSYQIAAEGGNRNGQYHLAKSFKSGIGTQKNSINAASWMEKAATQGHVEAQFHLGLFFMFGKILPHASDPLQAAAEQGNQNVRGFLAGFIPEFINNFEAQKNAIKWLEKAAKQNHLLSQVCFAGLSLESRPNRDIDLKTVEQLFSKALKKECPLAELHFGQWCLKCFLPRETAKELFEKANKHGNLDAKYELWCLNQGIDAKLPLPSNHEETDLATCLDAAEKGNPSAQLFLGGYYTRRKDPKNAIKWLLEASSQENYRLTVRNMLHKLYSSQKVDATKYETGPLPDAEKGDSTAQTILGQSYENRGTPEKAVNWYKKASKQGDRNAQTLLGLCYKNGKGVSQDLVKAEKWLRMAAEQGDVRAILELEEKRWKGVIPMYF